MNLNRRPVSDISGIFTTFKRKFPQKVLRTVIIDDESPVRITLARFLEKHCSQVKLVGEAHNVETGKTAIKKLHPDLVLLDVEMDDGNGFDLLNSLKQIDFKVVFITAYEKYAVQAFKYSAVDFLLKPVNPFELSEAVDRVAEIRQSDYNIRLKTLEENLLSKDPNTRKLILRTHDNIHLVNVNNILYCESDGCYTHVHTDENEKILISKPLKEYDELLSDAGFFRIHKSYLINLKHIKRFEKTDGGSIVLTNNHKVPVASRKKEELLELFERMAE
jgi:two-component system LytT family response regulator